MNKEKEMDIYSAIGVFIAIVTFYFMLRTDFRNSVDGMKLEMKEIQKEMKEENRNMLNLIIAIKDEIKDFHGRMCVIEERRSEK